MSRRHSLSFALTVAVIGLLVACRGTTPTRAADAPTTAPTTTASLATLTVTIVDVRSDKGTLVYGVFKSADGFPSDGKKAAFWQERPAANANERTFVCQLPPGRYGATVLHDENSNGKMDTGAFGIPKEGYGVTNNPKPKFSAATYKDATFDLPADGATLTISVQYF